MTIQGTWRRSWTSSQPRPPATSPRSAQATRPPCVAFMHLLWVHPSDELHKGMTGCLLSWLMLCNKTKRR